MSPDMPDLFVLRGFVSLLSGDLLGAKNDMTKSLVLGLKPPATAPQACPRKPLLTSEDAFDRIATDLAAAVEAVPRHTYTYGHFANQV